MLFIYTRAIEQHTSLDLSAIKWMGKCAITPSMSFTRGSIVETKVFLLSLLILLFALVFSSFLAFHIFSLVPCNSSHFIVAYFLLFVLFSLIFSHLLFFVLFFVILGDS